MTLKKLSIVSLTLFALSSMANAAAVNIATTSLAGPSRLVATTSNGGSIPIGSVVRIGVWQGAIPAITPETKVSSLTGFMPIGEDAGSALDGTNGPGTTNTATAAGSGWGFTINSVENTDPRFLAGTRLYIMILDSVPGQNDNATLMTILSDPGWTIPSSGARNMTSAQVDSQAEVIYGTWSATQFQMLPINVPEPSTTAVSLLLGLGLLGRRRR